MRMNIMERKMRTKKVNHQSRLKLRITAPNLPGRSKIARMRIDDI